MLGSNVYENLASNRLRKRDLSAGVEQFLRYYVKSHQIFRSFFRSKANGERWGRTFAGLQFGIRLAFRVAYRLDDAPSSKDGELGFESDLVEASCDRQKRNQDSHQQTRHVTKIGRCTTVTTVGCSFVLLNEHDDKRQVQRNVDVVRWGRRQVLAS